MSARIDSMVPGGLAVGYGDTGTTTGTAPAPSSLSSLMASMGSTLASVIERGIPRLADIELTGYAIQKGAQPPVPGTAYAAQVPAPAADRSMLLMIGAAAIVLVLALR